MKLSLLNKLIINFCVAVEFFESLDPGANVRPTPRPNLYRPQRSWGKVIFSVACVKNSVHRGVPGQVSPGRYTPRAGTPRPPVNEREVRILECIHVFGFIYRLKVSLVRKSLF